MATRPLFYPYRVVEQSASTLHLQPSTSTKTLLLLLRSIPLVLIAVGLVLSIVNNNTLYLLLLGGMGLLQAIIFSFIKIPSVLKMDRFGFTLQTLSLRGTAQNDYLWSEVDHLSQRSYRTKNGRVVSYRAHLGSGKKVNFMSFGNSYLSDEAALEINAILGQVSGKEVRKL